MTKWLYVVAALAVFWTGYGVADALRTADIERLKSDYAAAAQRYQAELTKKESDNARVLAATVDRKQAEINELGSQLAGMRRDVERLRGAAAGGGRVPAGTCDSGKLCERRIAECRRLLVESAESLEEGSRLVIRLSSDRSAVKEILHRP